MWVSTEIYKHTNFYSEGKKMKKKIIAALAASALFATVAGVSALAEGIEEDGEVLDEEIVEEEVVEDEEEEEDWEEEEEEEEEVEEVEEVEVEETEVEVVEVAPVASPKTGNSPIALAVIPVALAAAAVVAKKRG